METATYADLERKIGPRGDVRVTETNADAVRDWIALQGVPGIRVKRMKLWTLAKCYNSKRYLAAVLANVGGTDEDAEKATAVALADDPLAALKAAMADALSTVAGLTDEFVSKADARSIANDYVRGVLANDDIMAPIIRKHAPAGLVRTIEVHNAATGKTVDVGKQHALFEQLLTACAARTMDGHRLNIWLAGPAGSGKTTAAKNVAKALGLPFYFNGAIDNEYKLLGFTDAQGRIVSRPFREAFTKGGVYLFDEVDASLPPALLAFNAATANGAADFPDGIQQRHPDCIIIAAANTFGHGATAEYVGRYKQDAAFLDRFAAICWTVDEDLERALCPDAAWCEYVQRLRANVASAGLKVIISPRASFYGAALLAQGMHRDTVAAMTLRKGMSDDQWETINRA